MEPYSHQDPNRPNRPENDDPDPMLRSRLRAVTGWGVGAGPSSWRGSLATLIMLLFVLFILLLIIWLRSLG